MAFLDETGLQTLWTKIKNTFATTTHSHGNIKSGGTVGTTSGLPLITSTGGAVTTGTFGSAAGTFCQGNDARVVSAVNSTTVNTLASAAASAVISAGGYITTHNSAYNYLGTSGATANATTDTTNSTTYLTLVDGGGTPKSNLQITGAGATTVKAKNGVLTITGGITSTQAVDAVSAAGYVTSTYVSGATVASAGNATNLNGSAASVYAKAADYLPLSGGTMTGSITRSGNLAKPSTSSGSINIMGADTTANGAGIWLYGNGVSSGRARIQVHGSAYYQLDAQTDGVLSWNGGVISATTFSGTATSATSVAGTAGTSTLSWNTDVTLYTVGGNAIKAKLPANPNTNTTYTFDTGDANGQIKVTPSGGTAQNVSVKGLGTAAYTSTGAFADAIHTHSYLPLSGGTLTGDITVAQTSTNAAVFVDNGFTDSKAHKGALYTNIYGNFGIYDTTKAKWLLVSDSAGNVTMSGNALTATNASSLGGLTSAGYVQTGNVNQTVSGTKTFAGPLHAASSLYVDNGFIYGTDKAYTKGTTPTSDNYLFQILATDKNGTTAAYRLGAYQVFVNSNGSVANEISVYDNVSGSTATGARLIVWKPKNQSGFITIPDGRPSAGDSSTKVPDTAWVANTTVKNASSLGGVAAGTYTKKVAGAASAYASSTARNCYFEIDNGGTKFQVAYGRASINSAGTTVTFGRAFNAAPFVVAAPAPSSTPTGSGNNLSVLTGIATTTGVPMLVRKNDGNAITAYVNYVAVGTGA